MTNHRSLIKKYPLLPFSQLVYDVTRWMPGIYTFPISFRWRGGACEKERIEQAIRVALANHPVFSMRVDWQGRQYTALTKDILHGRYHDIEVSAQGEDVMISARFNRILGDGKSIEILLEDVLRAYQSKTLEPDDYWGYLEYVEQQKQSQHYAESKAWLEKQFVDESVPVHPMPDRCLWTLLPPKAGLHQTGFSDLQAAINQLTETQHLSLDGFFSLCAVLAIAEYCGADEAALTWAYEGRERPEEQRIFGSLHRDIPFKIRYLKSEIRNQKSNLIKEARNQIRSGIAHSDYPYTLIAPYTKRWNYAVNVLRVPDEISIQKQLPEYLELQSLQPQKYAYALLDLEIHEAEGQLALWYRYSATHYKESSIRRFAGLIRKYAEWLLEE